MAETTDDSYRSPKSAQELTQHNIESVAALDEATRSQRSRTDRVADIIAAFCGSMSFVYVHLVWFTSWLILNSSLMPKALRFDPYPYQFLTLAVSLEAIFLSTFILISQNRQGRLSDRRNHLDLQINLLSEQESSKMLAMLDRIQQKLGIEDTDPEVEIYETATRPEELARQIEEIIEHEHKVA